MIALLDNKDDYQMSQLREQVDISINPSHLSYIINENPLILYKGEPINPSHIIVRNSRPMKAEITLAVNMFDLIGTKVSDPINRFTMGYASKVLTTISRAKRGIGIPSYFAWNETDSIKLLEYMSFPFLYKPVSGSKGNGIEKVENKDTFLRLIANHKYTKPIMFQDFIEIKMEYRVMMYDNVILGIRRKKKTMKSLLPTQQEENNVYAYVNSYESPKGLLGIDVIESIDGKWYVIEENRSPQWELSEKVLGINFPEKIIECLK